MIVMIKTRRVNIFGPPNSGKSVLAMELTAELKKAGVEAYYTPEYVKKWAYEKKQIRPWDQVYSFAKHVHMEELALSNQAELIVTDAPLLLSCFYAKKCNFVGWESLITIALLFESEFPSVNIFLPMREDYQKIGRYETKKEAKQIEKNIRDFILEYTELVITNDINKIVTNILKDKENI